MSITLDRVLSGMSFPPSIAISQPQRTIVEQFEPVDIDLGTFDELPTRIADRTCAFPDSSYLND